MRACKDFFWINYFTKWYAIIKQLPRHVTCLPVRLTHLSWMGTSDNNCRREQLAL